MFTPEGVSSVANFNTALKSLNKTETPIFYLLCALCFKRQLLDVQINTALALPGLSFTSMPITFFQKQ